eukprot:COSAG01_NODE_2113_length_8396_cov_48.531638_3_plen_100_part_01
MEVATSWFANPNRRVGHVRFTTSRIISSLFATLDWVSDLLYADQVLTWSRDGYDPTTDEQLACVVAVADSDRSNGACADDGTVWVYDGLRLLTSNGSCAA